MPGAASQVVDCFGLNPHHRTVFREFMLMGVPAEHVADALATDVEVCHVYCRTIAEFVAVELLIDAIRCRRPDIKICLFENVQSVTSYSLRHVAKEFIEKGATCVIMGEPEDRVAEVTRRLEQGIDLDGIPGLAYRQGDEIIVRPAGAAPGNLDSLPMPAWEKFPLTGYWTAGFAHAPCGQERFLPILTSRGCPYRCTFCIAPEVNPTWRGRSARHVVDEMQHFYETLGITDFHVSDLDPTVSDKRTREICSEIIARKLPIIWKLAQGTKIETIKSEKTLELMAQAGCRVKSF